MIHGDVLGERARLSPDRCALVEVATGRRFTYRGLDERAVATARAWREGLGLAAGDRLALLSGNRVEFLDAFFAAGKAGVVLVPLSTRATAHELAGILADAAPRAVVYDGAFAEVVRELTGRADIGHWVALDEPAASGHRTMADLLGALAPSSWRRERCAPEDLYALLYTSGTTGRPKGVMIPHRMVAFNGFNTVASWGLGADDVSPIFTPLYHAGALGAFLVPIVVAGGTIVLHAGFDAEEVWRTLAAEGCTVVLGVPTVWQMLLEAPAAATADLSRVRWFISGGAPLPRNLVDAYAARGVVLRQGYGLTEVGVNCFAMSDAEAWSKVGSVGRPLLMTEARVADGDGRPLPAGEVGELQFRGPHVSLGYWRNPEATAAALDRDGWFHTGDLARVDEDGFFFIVGRLKDMIISGGVNIYPAEIEHELVTHPHIADAAIVGVPHPTWGEVGIAFIVPRGPAPTRDELLEFLRPRIAKYKLPKDVVFLDELPRTPYGKVLKGQLAEGYAARERT